MTIIRKIVQTLLQVFQIGMSKFKHHLKRKNRIYHYSIYKNKLIRKKEFFTDVISLFYIFPRTTILYSAI